jgi:hypothetical protein
MNIFLIQAVLLVGFLKLNLAVAFSTDLNQQWNDFKLKYSKAYTTSEEEFKRKQIWTKNYMYVTEPDSERSFSVGLNQYADRLIEVRLEHFELF